MGGNMSEKKRILVVEDETPLAMMMVFLLNRVGYAVTVAKSGQQGIELAARQPFDLITLDLNLPDIRGFEICSRLKNQSLSQNTPIVFVTGQREEENRQRAFELGAVDYIEKPFEMSDFVFRISRCLANFLPGQVMAHHH
jgi:DNA-binding response OmpR family regulator